MVFGFDSFVEKKCSKVVVWVWNDQERSSMMCTWTYLKLVVLYTGVPTMILVEVVSCLPLSEIHHYLFGLTDVECMVISQAPLS